MLGTFQQIHKLKIQQTVTSKRCICFSQPQGHGQRPVDAEQLRDAPLGNQDLPGFHSALLSTGLCPHAYPLLTRWFSSVLQKGGQSLSSVPCKRKKTLEVPPPLFLSHWTAWPTFKEIREGDILTEYTANLSRIRIFKEGRRGEWALMGNTSFWHTGSLAPMLYVL